MGASTSKTGPLFAPLVLRLALGATFIWAGLGKLVPIVDYTGPDAAILANLGTGVTPTKPTKNSVDVPVMAPPATLPLPDKSPGQSPASPKGTPTSRQGRPAGKGYAQTTGVLASIEVVDLPAVAGLSRDNAATRKPSRQGGQAGQPNVAPAPAQGATVPVKSASPETLPPGGKYVAGDFPEPAKARRAYQLSVLMVKAAYPQPATPGAAKPASFWPAIFAQSPWVVWLAFGAAVVELFAGVLILVGFLTRLSALMLVGIMLTAMWLTQVGPAVSTGQTVLWLLPNKVWWDPALWSGFFWQLAIVASGIAVAAMGAGALSVDRALAIIGGNGPRAEQDPSGKQ